jgi:hypothetical protein
MRSERRPRPRAAPAPAGRPLRRAARRVKDGLVRRWLMKLLTRGEQAAGWQAGGHAAGQVA